MESASAHFFSQRDLLVLVANHLITPNTEPDSEHQKQPPHKKDLARLCRTSRFLYRVCTPVLWRDIDLATFLPTTKMEKFVQQWRQLVTKGVLVRSLKIRKAFLVLHMSNTCVQSPSSTDSINNNQQLPSAIRPNWVLEPDSFNQIDMQFPPLTWLTRLEIKAGFDNHRLDENIHEAAGKKYFSGSQIFAHLCWLIHLNPWLTHLTLNFIHAEKSIDIRVLSRVLSRLQHLKHLHINPIPDTGSWRDAFETIFLSIPESVETLLLKPGNDRSIKESSFYMTPKQGDLDLTDGALVLRQDPLLHLKKLSIAVDHSDSSSYQWMMDHCLNIDTIEFLAVKNETGFLKTLAPSIQEYCHQIRHVLIRQEASHAQPAEFMHLIEGIIAPVETIYIENYKTNLGYSGKLAIHQHATTLRDVRFYNSIQIGDEIILEILSRCVFLERFEVKPKDVFDSVKIETLVSQKWACVGLKQLNLTTCWGEFEATTQPHYLQQQPAASEGSSWDLERWALLELFYRQIGRLLSLEVLEIKAVSPKKLGTSATNVTFPQLLTLGDGVKGRRAYLSWLGGLGNLRQIRGSSFRVGSHPELEATLGKVEAKYMLAVWPKLEMLELLQPFIKAPKSRAKGPGSIAINLLLKSKPLIQLALKANDDSLDTIGSCIPPSPGYMLEIWRNEKYYDDVNKHLPHSHDFKPPQPKNLNKKPKKKNDWRWRLPGDIAY